MKSLLIVAIIYKFVRSEARGSFDQIVSVDIPDRTWDFAFWMRWWLRCEWGRYEGSSTFKSTNWTHHLSFSQFQRVRHCFYCHMHGCKCIHQCLGVFNQEIWQGAVAVFRCCWRKGRTKGLSLLICAYLAGWLHWIWYLISVQFWQGKIRWFTWAEVAFQLERKIEASITVVKGWGEEERRSRGSGWSPRGRVAPRLHLTWLFER